MVKSNSAHTAGFLYQPYLASALSLPKSFWASPSSQYWHALPPARNQVGGAFLPPDCNGCMHLGCCGVPVKAGSGGRRNIWQLQWKR